MVKVSMTVVKELQATAAFRCREAFHDEGDGAKKERLEEFTYKAFHGDKGTDVASQAELLFNGIGAYSALYDEETFTTDEHARDVSSLKKQMKQFLTNDDNIVHTVGTDQKRDITLQLLKQRGKSNVRPVQGSTLYDAAKLVHANGKKMLAIATSWFDQPGFKMPSGKNLQEFYKHLLSEMCKMEGGKNGTVIQLDGTTENENGGDANKNGENGGDKNSGNENGENDD